MTENFLFDLTSTLSVGKWKTEVFTKRNPLVSRKDGSKKGLLPSRRPHYPTYLPHYLRRSVRVLRKTTSVTLHGVGVGESYRVGFLVFGDSSFPLRYKCHHPHGNKNGIHATELKDWTRYLPLDYHH